MTRLSLKDFNDIPKDTPRKLSFVRASDVKIEAVEWLDEEQLIPVGAPTLIQGMPGLGKSTWLCLIAARVSQEYFVLLSSVEDDWANTLAPRLKAAGANMAHVGFIQDGGNPGFGIPSDLNDLEEMIQETPVPTRLLGIDPLVGHLANGLDSNNDHHMRRALTPLRHIANRHKFATILIHHLNKAEYEDDMLRGAGSLGGIQGTIRSGLMFDVAHGMKRSDPYRTLRQFKSSVSETRPPQDFVIESIQVEDVYTSRLVPLPGGHHVSGGRDPQRDLTNDQIMSLVYD